MADEADGGEEEFDAVRQETEEYEVLKAPFDFKNGDEREGPGSGQKSLPWVVREILPRAHRRLQEHAVESRFVVGCDLPLAEEVVASCAICSKYVRLPSRPQVKLGSSAGVFNARLQADLFMCKEIWILLIIDEAARCKAASWRNSKDCAEIDELAEGENVVVGNFPEQNRGPECLRDRKQLSHHDESRETAPFFGLPYATRSKATPQQTQGCEKTV